MAEKITFRVNGVMYQTGYSGELTLLPYLRDRLGLMGTKNGCNKGHCGSCTVIVNGRVRRACLLKLDRLGGSEIETIENLTVGDRLHPLQEAFISEGAVQCGFCTPGMIMSAKALLDVNLCPTEAEIKEALRHNYCRCTGYAAIIRAVKLAAAIIRGEAASPVAVTAAGGPALEAGIGSSPPRKDALPKVTGKPIYADDLTFENMIYGKLLLSRYPSARIKRIDPQRALSAPGVVRILTAADIPGRNGFGLLNPHQPVLADGRVRYSGEAVALILAESEAAAQAGLSLIDVDYDELPGIFAADVGMRESVPALHPGGNLVQHISVRRGDTEKAFAAADVIIEGEYSTPMVEHAYLEPESALARLEDDGAVTVWTASQGSFAFRDMIAESLKLPVNKVRVIYTPAGGAFGGKEEPTVQIHCALGAYLTGRPVKMTLTRGESLAVSTKRHPAKMYYKHGATIDGRITAIEARVMLDAGAYESLSKPVVFRAGITAAGPYDIPNVKTDSYGVYTNHPPAGAFRGFGTTQVAFGSELQMDRLAEALKIDPFELRRINGLAPGKTTITGQVVAADCGYQQALAAVEKALQEYLRQLPKKSAPGSKVGAGIAGAYKNVGLGAGKVDQAAAAIEIDRQGKLLLKVGAADMGQGSDTLLAQVAAGETGLIYEDFIVVSNDTGLTPAGGVTTASRQTYISGYAVMGAAREFMAVFERCLLQGFKVRGGQYRPQSGGVSAVTGNGNNRFIPFREIAAAAAQLGLTLSGSYLYTAPLTYPLRERADHEDGIALEQYNVHFAYCYAVQAAVVEVDQQEGTVKVLKIIAAQDLGRAIHPQNCRCQIEGAVAMGLGYGLSEEFILENGFPVTDSFKKLRLPKITDVPDMDIILVEEAAEGPYGAKGMGELPLNPTAPAIINAIHDAVGVWISELPATKDKILKALKGKEVVQYDAAIGKRNCADPRSALPGY